ncbi:MAG: hypothetical protein V8S10_07835 [Clostridia bacterium]|jgi:hypothetical protein
MNLVCILGKIISNIEFKFIIKNKNKAIAIFKVKLLDDTIVTVEAYNEKADYCYSKLNKNDTIYIQGYINSKMQIIVKDIEKQEI